MARSRWTRRLVTVLAALAAALGAGSASAALGVDAAAFGPTQSGWARGLAATAGSPDWGGRWAITTTCVVPGCAGEQTTATLDLVQTGDVITGSGTDGQGTSPIASGAAAGASATLTFEEPEAISTFRLTLAADGGSFSGTIGTTDRESGQTVDPTGTIVGVRDSFVLTGRVTQRACAAACKLAGLAGVAIAATGGPGGPLSTVTDADGRYALSLGAGTWKVTPTLKGRKFEPKARSVEVKASVGGIDFDAGCAPARGGAPGGTAPGIAARAVAGVKSGIYEGTTQGCPPQTLKLEVDAKGGEVRLVRWTFTAICEVDGKPQQAKRPTVVKGTRGDVAPFHPKSGRFSIKLVSADARGHIQGRVLQDGTIFVETMRLDLDAGVVLDTAPCRTGSGRTFALTLS